MNKSIVLALTLISLVFMGCAEKKKKSGGEEVAPPAPEYVPPGSSESDSPSAYWGEGATVPLSIEGSTEFARAEKLSKYTGRTMYNPQDIQINVNLVRRENGGYGGRVAIGYYDNGVYHEGVFVNGDEASFPNTSEEKAAQYNRFFYHEGQEVFHGFFQDFQGGLIVVIDSFDSLEIGDGQPADRASGSIWFKNFTDDIAAPQSPTHCWFVSIGPYDCRAWKSGNGVDTYRSVYPDNKYIKLGEFSDLELDLAISE